MKKAKKFECVFCGCADIKGITVHDFKMDKKRTGVDWQLCPNHAITWMLRQLTPEQVEMIRNIAGGDTFHTHGAFYNSDGVSIQPIRSCRCH